MGISYVEAIRLLFTELEITRVPNRTSVLLDRIAKANNYQTQLKWRVNVGGAAVAGRATTADVGATNAADTLKSCILPIGDRVLGHTFSVLTTEIAEAKSAGEGAIKDLFLEHIYSAYSVIMPALNALLYSGVGSTASHGVFGLDQVVDATAYAGIVKATYPEWSGALLANGGTARALSRGLFDGLDVAFSRAGVDYDTIVTTPEVIKKYGQLFAADRAMTVAGPNGVADIGFSGYLYNGKPLLMDPQCPTGAMYFFNSSNVQLRTFATEGTVKDDGGNVRGVQVRNSNTLGLNFSISQLFGRNPDKFEFEIGIKPQLMVRNPRAVGIVRDIIQ